jgi:hypothetical protein
VQAERTADEDGRRLRVELLVALVDAGWEPSQATEYVYRQSGVTLLLGSQGNETIDALKRQGRATVIRRIEAGGGY